MTAPYLATKPDMKSLASSTWMRICTSFVLGVTRIHGADVAATIEQRAMRKHQEKHFHDGMTKLGLSDSIPIVRRVASYHYMSNALGGLPLEYVEESPNKIWLRYRAPYWVGDGMANPSSGPAALGIGMGTAPFKGWHANNGAVLGNLRLVFVQTQNLLEGDPWDAGYYTEADHDFPPGEGYVRKPGEWGPPFDSDRAPAFDTEAWPEARRLGALRNYAVSTTMSRLEMAETVIGPEATCHIAEAALRTVLSQFAHELPGQLDVDTVSTPRQAADYFTAFAAMIGDTTEVDDRDAQRVIVRTVLPRYWRYMEEPRNAIDHAFARAWKATLPLHAPALTCDLSIDDAGRAWTFTTTGRSTTA